MEKKFNLAVKIKCEFDTITEAVRQYSETLPDEELDKFADQWVALEKEGAQMVEITTENGEMVARPSDDFLKHCRSFGVDI